jgi:Fic family protein
LRRQAGYEELLRAVFDGHGEVQFGEGLILQFHARLLKYSAADQQHRGKYKAAPEPLMPYPRRRTESPALRPAAPDLVPGEMRAAIEWTAARLAAAEFHPLLVIASFILEFLAIRPFADGNGRLSRILTNFLLLRCGYAYVPYVSLESVIAQRWAEYYLALRHSQANRNLPRPDISPWLCAFLDAMRVQIDELKALIEGWPDSSRLSENQRRVLELLEREEDITNRLVCRELGIPKDTAKQVLNRLLALNLVGRAGAGRAVRYRRPYGLAR